MQIYGPVHVHNAQPVSSPHGPRGTQGTRGTQQAQGTDEVQISDAAQFVEQAKQLPEVRIDRVRELQAKIAAGELDDEQYLSDALDAFLAQEVG